MRVLTFSIRHALLGLGATIALTATSAHAGRNELSIGSTARTQRAGSANAISDDGMTSVSITYMRDVGLPDLFGADLEAVAGFDRSFANGVSFHDLEGQIDGLAFTAGLRGRRPLRWGLGATVRAGAGLARTALTLEPGYGTDDAIEDRHWAPLAQTALGLDHRFKPGGATGKLEVGLHLELGYTLAAPVEMYATPANRSAADGALTIPAEYASLGSLDTSGYTFHIGVFARF